MMRKPFLAVMAAIAALALPSMALACPWHRHHPSVKITPDKQMQFGRVPLSGSVTKPLKIINDSNDTIYYAGATWPSGPSGDRSGWPLAARDPDTYLSPPGGIVVTKGRLCNTIAPRSSCTMQATLTPQGVAGHYRSNFSIGYIVDWNTRNWDLDWNQDPAVRVSNVVVMQGTGK